MYIAGNGVSGVLRVKRNSGVLNANSGRGLGGSGQSGYCRSRRSGRAPDINSLHTAVRQPQASGFGAGSILTNCIGIPDELYGCGADGITVGIGVIVSLAPNLIRSLHAGGKQGLNIGYICSCSPDAALRVVSFIVIIFDVVAKPVISLVSMCIINGAVELEQFLGTIGTGGNNRLCDFPDCSVSHVAGHGISNRGVPADEVVVRAGRGAIECGGSSVGGCIIGLIRKRLTAHTVGVLDYVILGNIRDLTGLGGLADSLIIGRRLHGPAAAVGLEVGLASGVLHLIGEVGKRLVGVKSKSGVSLVGSVELVNIAGRIDNEVAPVISVFVLCHRCKLVGTFLKIPEVGYLAVALGILRNVICGILNTNCDSTAGRPGKGSSYCRSRRSGRAPDINSLHTAVRQPQASGFGAGSILTNCIGIPDELYGCGADGITVGIGVIVSLAPNLIRSLHAGGKQGLNIGYICSCSPDAAGCIISHVIIVLYIAAEPVVGLISMGVISSAMELKQFLDAIAAGGHRRLFRSLSVVFLDGRFFLRNRFFYGRFFYDRFFLHGRGFVNVCIRRGCKAHDHAYQQNQSHYTGETFVFAHKIYSIPLDFGACILLPQGTGYFTITLYQCQAVRPVFLL